jgi:CheY-like chemotaxis protein
MSPDVPTARPKFLIIEDNLDNRFLLTRTLARKFPAAEIQECSDLIAARLIASTERIDAVVLHRVDLSDGIELIRSVRQVNQEVPIIMVSGYDRTREALAAGATRFLLYDEWLRIGTVVEEVLETEPYAARISALTFAIERRFIAKLSCATDTGSTRTCEVEPHVVGRDPRGLLILRAFSVVRGSRSPLRTGWESYAIERIKTVAVSERLFAPHHEEGMHDPSIVEVIAEIEGTASAFVPRPAMNRSDR